MKTTITILLTLLSGGAMGAFITHYYANVQTIVAYSVNTTSLGAAAETKSVLRNMKLLMGNTEIPVVYTHTVEFRHSGGPELDHADLGLTLSGQGHLLGSVVPFAPDPVHQISCKDFDQRSQSVVCSVGQLSSNVKAYKILLATDQPAVVSLVIDGKNTKIQRAETASQENRGAWPFQGPGATLSREFGKLRYILST